MSTFRGSKGWYPKNDIASTLDLIPSGRSFLLATTFCCRSNRGIPYDDVIGEELEKMFAIFGRNNIITKYITVPNKHYSREGGVTMHFMIYVLQKYGPAQIID